jgi:hypothetical protein
MFIPVGPPRRQQSGVYGPLPTFWAGTNAVDGDDRDWGNGSAGDIYARLDRTNKNVRYYVKRKEDTRDDDWGALGCVHCISDTFTRAQMTDGGATTGTFVLGETIPVGAFVFRTILHDVTGFTGDTTATIQVGDGTDADRYSTGTPSVFTTANAIDIGAVSGTAIHTAAATITVTITSTADFTNVAAGQATLKLFYFF